MSEELKVNETGEVTTEPTPEASLPELVTISTIETPVDAPAPEPSADAVETAPPPIDDAVYTNEHRETYRQIIKHDILAAEDYLKKIWAEIKSKL